MSAIDDVKQRTDIVEVIGQYTKLTKAGRNFKALCPFHSEKHASFFVYPEQQSWHCFGACSTGGDVFSFIMKKEGLSFGEALHSLATRAGVTIPTRFEREEGKEEKEELYHINDAAARYFHNLLLNSPAAEGARNYAANRGFSQKSVTDFQLGFSPDSWESLKQYLMERGYSEEKLLLAGLIVASENGKTHDRFRGRLMFPIRDHRGRTIGFGARALDDAMPKYLNSPQTPLFDKSSILYGLDLAASAIRQQDMVIIVEGYIDVITAHQNGITNAVASMGTALTETNVNSLKKLTRNLVLALDADAAGEEAMLRGVSYENILDNEIKVVVLPAGKDPDNVIREDINAWQQLLNDAVPIIDYTFNMVTSQLDLTTARDKSLAVERLAPTINNLKDTVRYAHYRHKLARLSNTPEHELESALKQRRPRTTRRRTVTPDQEIVTHAFNKLAASPLEEYCLALLLQHPELKEGSHDNLLPEYFENSENREIFTVWQQSDSPSSLKAALDATLQEYLDSLLNKGLPDNQPEQRYANCILRLREKYLKGLEQKRAEIFALEVDSGGIGADLVRLEEQGIEPSIQLREVFYKKAKGG